MFRGGDNLKRVRKSRLCRALLGAVVGAMFFSGSCLPIKVQKEGYTFSPRKKVGYVAQGVIKSEEGSLVKGAKVYVSDFDVIALQEADRDQVGWLAKELGLYNSNVNCHGNAILSKHLISEHKCHKKSTSNLEAVIEIDGVFWHFFSAHLSYKFNDESHEPVVNSEREGQVTEVFDTIMGIEGLVVQMGDFNARPESKEIEIMSSRFKDAFADAGVGEGYTFPAWYADSLNKLGIWKKRRIDYIFTGQDVGVKSCHVIHYTDASDHFPLVATLKYKNTALKVMTYNIRRGEQKSILAILGLKEGKIDLAEIADTIRSENKITISDSNGMWALEGLSEGTYTISVYAEGYEEKSLTAKFSGGKKVKLEIMLEKK